MINRIASDLFLTEGPKIEEKHFINKKKQVSILLCYCPDDSQYCVSVITKESTKKLREYGFGRRCTSLVEAYLAFYKELDHYEKNKNMVRGLGKRNIPMGKASKGPRV